ncbi:hypothetical protein Sjap_014209 [Stephania japonica]|uniref:DYW domain-containing protein n=1 Tax=Stephania japonica TaxID=461633 RepID=A0AAP0J1F0_9MAGN
MASLPLQSSILLEASMQSKIPRCSLNFSHIPSSVSLNSSSSPTKTSQNQRGLIENVHLVSLSKQGMLTEALEFLKEMYIAGVFVNTRSYECILDMCGKMKSVSNGRIIHERIRRTIENPSGFLWNSLLQMYCDCCCFDDAKKLFDKLLTRDPDSWRIMLSAYTQNALFDDALRLFSEMHMLGSEYYSVVYSTLLRATSTPQFLELGKQLHSHLIRNLSNPDMLIDSTLFHMYLKCGCLYSSKLLFDRMAERNVVNWTELMVAYTQADKQKEALALFGMMLEEDVQLDEFVFSITLKACSTSNDFDTGKQIHGHIIKCGLDSNVSTGTPIVDLYVKCGCLEDALLAFRRIADPNDVSWSAIISGYSQYGKFEVCLCTFKNLRSSGMDLNSFVYTSIFHVCSAIADPNLGTQVHADAIKSGLVSDLYGESALISMYSRSGRLDYAHRAFDSIHQPDTVAWTAIISSYAYHGRASEALELFRRMHKYGARPNAVTFIGVFNACSHSGLVREARDYMDSMSSVYGVDPTIDHYNCMVDIYSRAGQLEEALKLINSMPFEPNVMSWKSLLGGCWIHKNVELGKISAENLLQLDPDDTAGYILLFNLYASSGKWEEAANIRKVMLERDLKKEVSCSWLVERGNVHRFIVGDRHHPQTEEIYTKLEQLNLSTMGTGNSPSYDEHALHSLPAKRKEQLLEHSERLAISFGLISSHAKTPVFIFKNLRACVDCHEFAKRVSKITRREIVIRDSNRFHHFKGGLCSCNDYW